MAACLSPKIEGQRYNSKICRKKCKGFAILNKIKWVGFFLVLFVSLEANYCVQVSTADRGGQDFIVSEAKSINYDKFANVRVEQRGNYFVFRVGDFQSYEEAQVYNKEIKNFAKGSYVRKCDLEKDKVVFSKNDENSDSSLRDERENFSADEYNVKKNSSEVYSNKKPENTYNRNNEVSEKSNYQEERKETPVVVKKKYIDKSELVYSSKNNEKSLWDECKKCFAPMYEEEKEYEYEKPVTSKPQEHSIQRSQEIEVRVQEKQPTQKSFWTEDTQENKKSHFNTKSKYNINDEYLP